VDLYGFGFVVNTPLKRSGITAARALKGSHSFSILWSSVDCFYLDRRTTNVCCGCAKVATVTSEGCRAGVSPPAIENATSGYIASVVLSDTPECNDGQQTWTIRAEPGQQIGLTLYDFYARQPTPEPSSDRQLNYHSFSRGRPTASFCHQLHE